MNVKTNSIKPYLLFVIHFATLSKSQKDLNEASLDNTAPWLFQFAFVMVGLTVECFFLICKKICRAWGSTFLFFKSLVSAHIFIGLPYLWCTKLEIEQFYMKIANFKIKFVISTQQNKFKLGFNYHYITSG